METLLTMHHYRKINLFYFFDPTCNICRTTFEHFKTQADVLAQSQLICFTLQPADSIKRFLERMEFILPANMQLLIDTDAEFSTVLDIKGPPTSLIYDKKGFLIKRYEGPVKIETLQKYLLEN